MKRCFIFICYFMVLLSAVFAGETEDEKKDIKPILQQWEETLQFGIADEVLGVLKEIREAGETSLNPELVAIFKESISDKLKIAILDYFIELEYKGLESACLSILDDYTESSRSLVSKSIDYLATIKSAQFSTKATELLDATEDEIAIAAIQGIGASGDTEQVALLLEKLADVEYTNKRKPEIILALGKLGSEDAVPALLEIVDSNEEERIWRLYAADALGKIGAEEAIPVLKKLFNEEDAILRSYAAAALGTFKDKGAMQVLIQGLKDSNWKVRVQAAKGLANENSEMAIDILKYKVKNDPVPNVQIEAVRALGAIGKTACFRFLREIYADEKKSVALREEALAMLAEHDLDHSADVIIEVVTPELEKKTGKSPLAELTGKHLAGKKSSHLEKIYGLFLQSNSIVLRIYAIRGAALNRFSVLKDQIKALADDDKAGIVQQEALSALEKF